MESKKRWKLFPKITAEDIKNFPEQNPVILQLLYNRDLKSQEEIDEFLYPDYSQDLHDPFIFQDMEKVCLRIEKAVKNKEKIVVWGDYDADGITSTVLLVSLLEKMGAKKVIAHIPTRKEGYGLNLEKLKEFEKDGTDLLITVDCGIANKREVAAVKMDVIITDHHQEPLELPDKAYAIIDPQLKREKYPFKPLAGVGIAFKVAQALVKRNGLGESFEKWLLDLVAIGTISDIAPLFGENRTLVKYGIIVLGKTPRLGLREIIKVSGLDLKNISATQISWQLGPRFNASGRIKDALISYQLLKTDNLEKAKEYANKVQELNIDRQKMTDIIMSEINDDLDLDSLATKNKVLFAIGRNWPLGLIGIVAGKMKEIYWRPFFIITRDEEGRIKGSGRSIEGLNITDVLKKVDDLLDHYGGHEMACGFTLKEDRYLDEFKKRVTGIIDSTLSQRDVAPLLEIDAKVSLDEVNWELYELLEKFEPFGEQNWQPRYLAEGVEVVSFSKIGKDKSHLRLMVRHNSSEIRKLIGFRFGSFTDFLQSGDKVDMVFEVGVNEWNGSRELEIKIIDIKKCRTKN